MVTGLQSMQKMPVSRGNRAGQRGPTTKVNPESKKSFQGPETWKQPDEKRESLTSFIVTKSPPDEVFMAAAEKFASWAAREEVTEEYPVKYLTGLNDQEDFDRLTKTQQKAALNLAFSAYRFIDKMEEICIDSGFMPDGAPIPDELNSLALVMLWELSERKFVLRGSRSKAALGTRIEEVLEVEKYLEKYAVKLAASLARLRIRESSLSLASTMGTDILESEKLRSEARLFTWSNPFALGSANVTLELEARRIEYKKEEDLRRNLMSFDPSEEEKIERTDLIKNNQIIISDATSPVPAEIFRNLSNQGFNLSNGEDTFNLLHAGGTFNSVPMIIDAIHAAGVTLENEAKQKNFLFGSSDSQADITKPKLLLCAKKSKHVEIEQKLAALGINNDLYVLLPPLSTIEAGNKILSTVKLCIVEPECSLTLAADPIQYLLIEGKGYTDSDQRLKTIAEGVQRPQEGLKTVLQAALSLPKSCATIYLTRSKVPAENEEVVQAALSACGKQNGFKLSTVPLEIPIEVAKEMSGKFLRLPIRHQGSGLFCAVLTRNQMDSKVQLRKAALKGLYVPSTNKAKNIKK